MNNKKHCTRQQSDNLISLRKHTSSRIRPEHTDQNRMKLSLHTEPFTTTLMKVSFHVSVLSTINSVNTVKSSRNRQLRIMST